MTPKPDDVVRQVTAQLNEDRLWELGLADTSVHYRPAPDANLSYGKAPGVWRVRFDMTFSADRMLGLDLNGEVILGRGDDVPELVSLDDYEGADLGVSRRHAMLLPTEGTLYITDLGSTNGTLINGRSIGVSTPYSLSNGDLLQLGKLEFLVRIIQRPRGQTSFLNQQADDLADVITPMASAIMSRLDVDEVLAQVLEMTMSIESVDEASIWLVDERTGELFLEAEQGIQNDELRRMRLSVQDTLAGKVIATGELVRANRQAGGDQIKLKTGYLVDAVIYVPLKLGGVTFGVLSAVHREDGKSFARREEKIMAAIADFAAVAVQNARLFQSTRHALSKRTKIMTALDYVLAYDLKHLLNVVIGYGGLLSGDPSLDDATTETAQSILEAGNNIAAMVEQLVDVMNLCCDPALKQAPCDAIDLIERVISDLHSAAAEKSTKVNFRMMGEPYLVKGDSSYMYRCIYHLVDNAVRHTPPESQATVTLVFGTDLIVRVRDDGPGIPENDLPHLFDRYYRGSDMFDGASGLGLGLEFVRSVVEAHKGTVIVRNAEEGGAEFIITLPGTLRIEAEAED